MAHKHYGKLRSTFFITIAAFVLAMVVSVIDLVQMVELKSLDARFRFRGVTDVSESDIIIIGIDDQSYEELPGQMPFPREYYARMIKNLQKAGARMVVFDVQLDKEKTGDSTLAAAITDFGNVVLCGKVLEERNPNIEESLIHLYPPNEMLLSTGVEWGLVNEPSDPDGFTRRYLLFQPVKEVSYLPIGMKAVKLLKGYTDADSIWNDDEFFYMRDLKIPRMDAHTMLVNWCGPARTFPNYPLSNILDDSEFDLLVNDTDYMEAFYGAADLPPEFAALLQNPFKDKICFLGATIEEMKDTFFSPFYGYGGIKEKTPGVEYHANALWTILNEAHISKLSTYYIWLLMLIFAIITAIVVYYLKPVGGLAALVLQLGALGFLSFYVFNNNNIWVEISGPALAGIFTFLGTGGYQFLSEQKEKKMIKGMFSHYLAKDLVDELVADPEKLKLGGSKKELTVFFSDIEGFTSISEGLEPEKLLEFLNDYLSVNTDIVLENDGMVDKYIGDAIVAVWGAPIIRDDHARLACKACIQIRKFEDEMRPQWVADGKPAFRTRMGVNTGAMTIGNVGSHQRLSYTVIGDMVNLGARLESINKQYKSYIMISEYTRDIVKDEFQTRELDLITVKGKTQPVRVFQLLEEGDIPLPEAQQMVIKHYAEGLKRYRDWEWEKAMESFQESLKFDKLDYPSRMYIERCLHYKENPPPEAWDGVWVWATK